ncbi:hypothetical protein L211DRAFT_850507 [Terfezia boudieri ATCC MYA-4762]|uniref:Uncharacterized protein n=1 Tax=Terfezia boudieri ATCC MYA-4762 TaxID=1051890 RepID=A0A3N4LI93_9PEZI|nr:hypothetical protein L211DRAFT_850507 [Terfezia boudieri ATCC MYA-4762]
MQFQSLYHSVFFVLLLASQLVIAAPLRKLEVSGAVAPTLDATVAPRAPLRDVNLLSNNNSPKDSGNNSNNNINSNHHNQGSPTTTTNSDTHTKSIFNDEVNDISQNPVLGDQDNTEKSAPIPERRS